MIIGIDMGHTLSGAGTGAVGFVSETVKNREIGKNLIEMLNAKGHKTINCTVDKGANSMSDIVAKANKQPLDLFLSIHLNSFHVPTANGIETFSIAKSGTGFNYAKKIHGEITKGFTDRGVKQANFYVLKNTKAPAVLVECGFVSCKADMDKLNTYNMAKALFKGITGSTYENTTTAPKPPTSDSNDAIIRVKVDGVQVGAFRKIDSVLNIVKDNIGKTIEIK